RRLAQGVGERFLETDRVNSLEPWCVVESRRPGFRNARRQPFFDRVFKSHDVRKPAARPGLATLDILIEELEDDFPRHVRLPRSRPSRHHDQPGRQSLVAALTIWKLLHGAPDAGTDRSLASVARPPGERFDPLTTQGDDRFPRPRDGCRGGGFGLL